jgi:hypothetical protein
LMTPLGVKYPQLEHRACLSGGHCHRHVGASSSTRRHSDTIQVRYRQGRRAYTLSSAAIFLCLRTRAWRELCSGRQPTSSLHVPPASRHKALGGPCTLVRLFFQVKVRPITKILVLRDRHKHNACNMPLFPDVPAGVMSSCRLQHFWPLKLCTSACT